MPRWLLPFEAIDPNNTKRLRATGISQKKYDAIVRYGHEKQTARILLIEEVLGGGTKHIYGGWSRPDTENCSVYVGTPSRDFKSLSIETPPPPGMVFLVFVLPDGSIDEWTWRPADDDGKPEGVEGELIWSANQT